MIIDIGDIKIHELHIMKKRRRMIEYIRIMRRIEMELWNMEVHP